MPFTSLPSVVPSLSEAVTSEPAVSPVLVGVAVFVVLMAMVVTLVMFGAGRDHS